MFVVDFYCSGGNPKNLQWLSKPALTDKPDEDGNWKAGRQPNPVGLCVSVDELLPPVWAIQRNDTTDGTEWKFPQAPQ